MGSKWRSDMVLEKMVVFFFFGKYCNKLKGRVRVRS